MADLGEELVVYGAIAVMAGATLVTRLLGPEIMRRLGESPRAERFLEALSSAVVAGIVATVLARGSWREVVAVAIAGAVMLATRSALAAMALAMAAAALWTAAT